MIWEQNPIDQILFSQFLEPPPVLVSCCGDCLSARMVPRALPAGALCCSESWKDASDTKTEVLNAKTKTRLGFRIVRAMYETGKLTQVTAEMRRYSLHVLGVSECRWTLNRLLIVNKVDTVYIELCLCHSEYCSMMLQSVKNRSVHPHPLQNPACSFLRVASVISSICHQ